MAIIVNENDSMKLWGFVSCHHLTPRYIPFPIRDACEFILQVFGVQLSMEQQFKLHMAEKKIQKTQALLSDMILKDVPFGIITRSPNVMDLVNCNGAAFSYDGVCRVLGVTPTELQIKDIISWLIENDKQ
ncbi:Phytochrome [Thalictrum thalictroides]|uniref:Phytochrome n=1 Tax=Thalictrum thalictroides TaxID=46969 RepID=A0A7J6WAA8_THATH|nr:Phytochrome [Thalictrum thalictroides]